ncbi:response regulator [Segetibacter sp.]|jgi:CheY-like chemotaxis protein|uniref:response regulator n=1 Tax=Segetibacter sp. TaxID=2231182 RepID=UPI002632BBCF|nr:response regulator [Segetibacter sp.]MCW3082418.1 response regulator receiver protein [Segetibacter sp.]
MSKAFIFCLYLYGNVSVNLTNDLAMHILMADDDKDEFLILQEAAEKAGEKLQLSYAGNWLELWRFILKTLPDVLFLDINMPVKDGIECLQLLRKERKYDEVPILIYSTSVSKADIDNAYKNGANYFIVKPNAIDDITKIIKKLLSMGKETLRTVPPREEFVIL